MNDIASSAEKRSITIYIDAEPYRVTKKRLSGTQLRDLPTPPLKAGQGIWLDIIDEPDDKIGPDEVVELENGMRFFTNRKPRAITILIDRVAYDTIAGKTTAALIRTIPNPDVAEDRHLWLDVPDGRDLKLADDKEINLKDGMRFYTAPGRINPGSSGAEE